MFGMSFGELMVLIVVGVVVIGPRDLPKMLGKLGRFAGRMRRMAADLRQQSGIDEILRTEGIRENLTEIRKLARGELDQITEAARIDSRPFAPDPPPASPMATMASGMTNGTAAAHDPEPRRYPGPSGYGEDLVGLHAREYPHEGADNGGALPDTAFLYTQGFAPSALATDPLYVTGDPDGLVPTPWTPPEPEPTADASHAADAGQIADTDHAANASHHAADAGHADTVHADHAANGAQVADAGHTAGTDRGTPDVEAPPAMPSSPPEIAAPKVD